MNLKRKLQWAFLAAIGVIGLGGVAWSQGQTIITTLAGTELINVQKGPQFTAITAANLAAYVTAGGGGASLAGTNTWTGVNTFANQIVSTAGLPTIASGACGATTNGAVVAGSTNQSGNITIGSAGTTTCTVSFSATLGVAPNACIVFPTNATAAATGTTVAYVSSITTGHFVLTGSALASANYAYICL